MSVLPDAFRALVRKPAFAAVAMLTLAFGFCANTTIFSLAETLLLRPLPYDDAARLVMVWQVGPRDFGDEVGTSLLDYFDWRREAKQLASLAAYGKQGFNLTDGDGAEYVEGQVVSANFFATLGTAPVFGRSFRVDEESSGAPRVVVLSDGLWRRRYGADRAILGRSIVLSGEPYTVVGIMPARWRAPERSELWVPLSFYNNSWRQWRAMHQLTLIARLAPGVSVAAAQSELRPIARTIWDEAGAAARSNTGATAHRDWDVRLEPLVDQLFGDYRRTVIALWLAVALVLMITCANLANLLLVRGISRSRELALRAALGASRIRLVAEVAAESALLTIAGAAAGIGAAVLLRPYLYAMLPQPLVHLLGDGVSRAGMLYTAAIALVSAIVLAAIPAWRVGRTDVRPLLATARTVGGRHRIGYAFVILQVALSVPLVAGCLLMARTMRNLSGVDAGLRTDHVVTFRLAPSPAFYAEPLSRPALFRRIEEELASMPGVEQVGMSSNLPFSRIGTDTATSLFVDGRPREERGAADVRAASPGLLRALGMRLVRGRWIEERDMTGPRAAVINESTAAQLWPHGDPIGARIIDGRETLDPESPNRWFTIVGIVADAKSGGLRSEPVPEVYLPVAKRPTRSMMFAVRGASAGSVIAGAREAVRRVDPRLPIFDVVELTELVDESIAGPRLAFGVFSAMGLAALLLATIGTYAVVAYSVGLRRQELGIRASLGATPSALWQMILRDSLAVAEVGIVIGALLARAGAGTLASVVYGVETADRFALAIATATMLCAVIAATLSPAIAAMRVNPAEALRQE